MVIVKLYVKKNKIMFETTTEIIEAVYGSIPYSNQINGLEIGDTFIKFRWRANRYKIDVNGNVDDNSDKNILTSTSASILMHQLIHRYYTSKL